MYPYLFTFTFLALMSLFTTQTFHKAVHESLNPSFENSLQQMQERMVSYRAEATLESLKEGKETDLNDNREKTSGAKKTPKAPSNEKPKPPLNFSKVRPPNNARLNLFPIALEETPSTHSYFPVFERLILILYGEHPLPNSFSSRLFKELARHKELIEHFTLPDQLATLEFIDQEIHQVFTRMLKGSYGLSLMNYIAFDSKAPRGVKKLSFLYLPKELLFALCPNEESFLALEELRKEAWEEIEYLEAGRLEIPIDQWKGRSDLKRELSERYDLVAQRHDTLRELKSQFEFSLGKKGDIAFFYDPVTEKVIREIVVRRS